MSDFLQDADALVLVGDSERNSDLFWATGFRAPDPFMYIAAAESAWVVVKDLEIDRARSSVRDAEVVASSLYEERIGNSPSQVAVLGQVLRDRKLQKLLVPEDFPVSMADRLRQDGFDLHIAATPLFPARAVKNAQEVAAIAGAQQAAEAGMQTAIDAIGAAEIRADELYLEGEPLTSEVVRRLIHRTLVDHECTAQHTIVAGGEQGIDPHQAGHGVLPAHQPIIIDIFPRHDPSGYFGDITRTVVRGIASDEAQRLYDTVLTAQMQALGSMGDGVDGQSIHEGVAAHFADAGYESGPRDGRMQGFFHGTGHGVGLDIHEAPSLSRRSSVLKTGHAVTVEPGLYYAGLGGVRIEDLVVVEADGCRNLTTFPKELVL